MTDVERLCLQSLPIRLAALLSMLSTLDVVETAVSALKRMARSPGPLEDVERCRRFAMKRAMMTEADKRRWRRTREETGRFNAPMEIREEAEDKARAVARDLSSPGLVASLRSPMDRGGATREFARAALQGQVDTAVIAREIGLDALA